ncbi:MAG: RNA methyltransferase [Bacteroidota bacterium]
MQLSKSEVKYLRSLSQKKVRAEEKKFLVEGWRTVKDALESSFSIDFAAITDAFRENSEHHAILDQLKEQKITQKEITEIELNQVCDTVHAQGIVALVRQKEQRLELSVGKDAKLVVIVDGVSDPGNAGSIVRTSDWFGVNAILFGTGCVELYNEKVVRSTAGSIFHIPIVENVDLSVGLKSLKEKGFLVVSTAADGKTSLEEFKPPERTAIIVGSEARGVSEEARALSDVVLKISKFGKAESLNVGVACGIVLSHLKSRHSAKS